MKNRESRKEVTAVNPELPNQEIMKEQFNEALSFTKASLNAFPCAASSFSDVSAPLDERNKDKQGTNKFNKI